MQADRLSLNAVRAFARAAEHRSFKHAAIDLGVTPGAVSHQVRNLEDTIGTALFSRRNNAIELTDAGQRLFDQLEPALRRIHLGLTEVIRSTDELTVISPMSFAVRWLIPRIYRFKTLETKARIRVETHLGSVPPGTSRADIVIAYRQRETAPDDETELLPDNCRPYLAPCLLKRLSVTRALSDIPALQCSEGNWDWHYWLSQTNQQDIDLRYVAHFDLDDAALRAAVGGLGMVLAPSFMMDDELGNGDLVALPDEPEARLGCYTIRSLDTALSRRFRSWIFSEAASTA